MPPRRVSGLHGAEAGGQAAGLDGDVGQVAPGDLRDDRPGVLAARVDDVGGAELRGRPASRPGSTSTATTRAAPAATAPTTTNEPMAPAPLTTTTSPGRTPARSTACRATASGWASAASSSPRPSGRGTSIRRGHGDALGEPAVGGQPGRPVRGAEVGPAGGAPAAGAAPDAGPGGDAQRRRPGRRPSPTSSTTPTNSWPSTTGPSTPEPLWRVSSGVRTGPARYSVASVPQSPARVTRRRTSPGPGSRGSGRSSTRASPAWCRTRALMRRPCSRCGP